MPNRRLTKHELENFAYPLLAEIREKIQKLTNGDAALLWALRRKVAIALTHDERGKPMVRVALKKKKRKEQNNLCKKCNEVLPAKGAVLDRLTAMGGYTEANTQLLCPTCDSQIQRERKYT